jgi:hypothetical protein
LLTGQLFSTKYFAEPIFTKLLTEQKNDLLICRPENRLNCGNFF